VLKNVTSTTSRIGSTCSNAKKSVHAKSQGICGADVAEDSCFEVVMLLTVVA
jgi:hypothetical protein